MNLQQRIVDVNSRIAEACKRSGRDSNSVHIVAVTKYVSVEKTIEAVESGLTHLGENRWQNAKSKWEAIGNRAVWHYIGSLQTNKVKDVVGKFAYIHSLDRLSLAEEIEKKASVLNQTVKCFLQLNVSGEESKHGLSPDELFVFAEQVNKLPHIEVAGLMTMAPLDSVGESSRPVFRRLRELRDELNEHAIFSYPVSHLSMGMSGDFEVAVEEGATWVRLGSVLVGRN